MTEQNKIGVILSNISFRSDIRLFISELSKSNKVVLFGSLNDYKSIECQGCEFREIKEIKNPIFKIYNTILRKVYFYIGNLPNTKNAYNDYQVRLIHKSKDKKYIKKSLKTHRIKMFLPHFFSFDKYLSLLTHGKSYISDIDLFIAYSDFNKDNLLSQIIKEKKRLVGYIHSWDHIPKFTRFLKNNITYITWNEFIKDDLVNIHNIENDKILTLGASQFYFIKDFITNSINQDNVKEKYIYFPCSFGYPKIAIQEVKIIINLSEQLSNLDNNIKLIVRPYPMLKSWNIYKPLETLDNIVFDDFKQSKDLYMDQADHLHKCKMIENALAVFHSGTTIGLEASYFETPVIYLNVEDIDYGFSTSDENHIFYSWNQYHLKKYYFLPEYSSVVKDKKEMKEVLKIILSGNVNDLLHYNKHLRTYSPLYSKSEFISAFEKLIEH
ncbi:MAG: hypothetical protein CSA39_04365 [Flavobacteriales bacterium]|nr:MAG: hypothetical protein CSA39_04365 [Flavobacteriales bacterium]